MTSLYVVEAHAKILREMDPAGKEKEILKIEDPFVKRCAILGVLYTDYTIKREENKCHKLR